MRSFQIILRSSLTILSKNTMIPISSSPHTTRLIRQNLYKGSSRFKEVISISQDEEGLRMRQSIRKITCLVKLWLIDPCSLWNMWATARNLREVRLTTENFRQNQQPKNTYQDDMNTSQAMYHFRERPHTKASTKLIKSSHFILIRFISINQETHLLLVSHATNKLNHPNLGIRGPQDRGSWSLPNRAASKPTAQMLSRQRTPSLHSIEKPMGMICFLSSSNQAQKITMIVSFISWD